MASNSVSGSKSCSKADEKDLKKSEEGEQSVKSLTVSTGAIASTLSRLKKQVQADRVTFVKTRTEANSSKLQSCTAQIAELSEARSSSVVVQQNSESTDLLTIRIQKALCRLIGPESSTTSEKESGSSQEDGSNGFSPIIFGSSSGGKSVVRPIKLPAVQRIPPYTTWIFLDRNQRMAEDQSVVGRRRIYYDQSGGEALICSDSEEELVDDEEERHEFSNGDDFIIWMALQEHGLSEAVLEALGNCIEAKPSEIEARYEVLIKDNAKGKLKFSEGLAKYMEVDIKEDTEEDKFEDKDLDAAMDSFDNLFCRRCLVFDCRLHGCSQSVILPSEKQPPWTNPEGSSTPCGPNCRLLASCVKDEAKLGKLSKLDTSESNIASLRNKGEAQRDGSEVESTSTGLKRQKPQRAESACSTEKLGLRKSNIGESADPSFGKSTSELQRLEPPRKGKKPGRKPGPQKRKRRAEEVLINIRKRQCRVAASDTDSVASGGILPKNDIKEKFGPLDSSAVVSERIMKRSDVSKGVLKKVDKMFLTSNRSLRKQDATLKVHSGAEGKKTEKDAEAEYEDGLSKVSERDIESVQKCLERKEDNHNDDGSSEKIKDGKYWSFLEKGLYEKGLEIFGRNSCLIARNMLKGVKTCIEVAEYILQNDVTAQRRVADGHISHMDGSGKLDCSDALDVEVRPRTRFWRRRGRVRRLKYTWKSAGHPAIRKGIADGKDQPCKQYSPCGCQFSCGKQCSCSRNGTCCEKYCGCSKSCKNRFRGCHCAKSQCRSRQCPCFAAGRECDPDVCRNCWVGCGDGTLGGPPQRGDNYECRNMKLLLKQQQRVLLGRSDVAGWGAFLKNPVSKHDYLGEYTGELISHREADKRGKIYDRENSSFLFNLNDQYVLDAYRKGDKLKFANHSPNPNCYAKVIMVAGDHRVGIFAKERISAGEELFYDYRYEPDRAPIWARKPESSNIKRDETSTTGGRAQKVA